MQTATLHVLTPLVCCAAAAWWRDTVLDLGNRDQDASVLRTKHNDFSDDSRTMQVVRFFYHTGMSTTLHLQFDCTTDECATIASSGTPLCTSCFASLVACSCTCPSCGCGGSCVWQVQGFDFAAWVDANIRDDDEVRPHVHRQYLHCRVAFAVCTPATGMQSRDSPCAAP